MVAPKKQVGSIRKWQPLQFTIHLWNLTLGKYSSKHQLSGGMLNFGRVLIDGQHLQDVNPNHFQLGWLKQLQMIWEIYTSGNQDGYQNGWFGKYISCHLFSNMAIFVFSSMINLLGIFFQESEVRDNYIGWNSIILPKLLVANECKDTTGVFTLGDGTKSCKVICTSPTSCWSCLMFANVLMNLISNRNILAATLFWESNIIPGDIPLVKEHNI